MLASGQEFMHRGRMVVHLTVRRNTRRMSARWRDGKVYLVVPPSTTADEVHRVLDGWMEELERMAPRRVAYSDGQRLGYADFEVTLRHRASGDYRTRMASRGGDGVKYQFEVTGDFGASVNGAALEVTMQRVLYSIAEYITRSVIVPRAARLARELGCEVRSWAVSHGRQRLGTCSRGGDIRLSKRLALMSRREQLDTITHELAHLKHFDHSPAFHAEHRRLLEMEMPDEQKMFWSC